MGVQRAKLVGLVAATATAISGVAVLGIAQASAAPTDVVINEMMFHAVSDLDGDDYLELYNRGTDPVDLSGWSFSGITLTLPAGTTIAAGRLPRRRQGRGPVPGDLRVRARRGLRRQPVQLRRDRRPQGRHRRHDRHRLLPRRRPLAGQGRRHRPSLELIDATLDNNDSAQLGRGHQRPRAHPGCRQLGAPRRPRPPHHQRRRQPRPARRPTSRSRSPRRSPTRPAPCCATASTSTPSRRSP